MQQPAVQDAERRKTEAEQIDTIVAQQEMFEYIQLLRQRAKVKIIKPIQTATVTEVK